MTTESQRLTHCRLKFTSTPGFRLFVGLEAKLCLLWRTKLTAQGAIQLGGKDFQIGSSCWTELKRTSSVLKIYLKDCRAVASTTLTIVKRVNSSVKPSVAFGRTCSVKLARS